MVGDGKSGALFWPAFDKSLFNGKGDRVTQANWKKTDSHPALDVLIFEGWCIGFQPLGHTKVKNIWGDAQGTDKKLASTRLQDVLLLDDELKNYCDSFMSSSMVDFIVHLDVQSLETIYMWREEQEQKLRQRTDGLGMTELEVRKFVDGYMPAYEMYLDGLRQGFFSKDVKLDNRLYLKLDSRRLVTNSGIE
ncbi:hypothetical protein V501_03357 [Pseudogymnoascus sp. VKM F-4519 (FW-2642)]|nr:hypothetical protein V501_03357 [Pseudogymnoascus sp. VKM F-4519 (FW-2642)]